MRKRLLALATALVLACSLVPGFALAVDGNGEPVSVIIEIGENGAPVGASGTGWTYRENGSGVFELALESGYAFTLTGHAFGASGEDRILNSGIIVDGVFNARVDNCGGIEGGEFNESVYNGSSEQEAGTIAGGTFTDYVNNAKTGTIAGGTFNDGSNNNAVDSSGTITGGEFNINVNNGGTIEGNGMFSAGVQNGNARFDADENKSCTISGGTFSGELDNFGTIEGGTFNGKITSRGIIAGGSFTSTGSVASNDEDTTAGGGTISGGIFACPVTSGDADPDWNAAVIVGGTFQKAVTNYGVIEGGMFEGTVTNAATFSGEPGTITGGTFLGDVTNRGVIEGGFFALPIVIGEGGSVSAGTFPVHTALTGLSIAEAANAELFASFEKDSEEANRFTLKADGGYELPDAIAVSLGSADGPELAAGTDYTYDTATGAVAVKKGAASGPLFLVASGVPAIEPAEPVPPGTTEPESPERQPSPCSATPLAATGDNVLPQVVGAVALLAGTALAASAAACLKRRSR